MNNGKDNVQPLYRNTVIIHPIACLGQFEGSGVLIKVSIELIHAEGVDGLVGSVFDVFQDEGHFKGFAKFLESHFGVRDGWVG